MTYVLTIKMLQQKKVYPGKDALQSDESQDFPNKAMILKIMLSKAMEIMTKDAGATGSY